MKFSPIALGIFALAGSLAFSSCKKDKDNTPTYGSATVDGKSYNFTVSESRNPTTTSFQLTNSTDTNSTSSIASVTVYTYKRPTSSQDFPLGDSAYVSFLSASAAGGLELRSYGKTGQKLTATVTNGKVKYSFTNLTETESIGGDNTPDGKPITGSVSEK